MTTSTGENIWRELWLVFRSSWCSRENNSTAPVIHLWCELNIWEKQMDKSACETHWKQLSCKSESLKVWKWKTRLCRHLNPLMLTLKGRHSNRRNGRRYNGCAWTWSAWTSSAQEYVHVASSSMLCELPNTLQVLWETEEVILWQTCLTFLAELMRCNVIRWSKLFFRSKKWT